MKKIMIIRIILLILIAAWMIIVFKFSNENAEKSSKTSGKVTEQVVEVLNKDLPEREKEKKVKEYQPIIRKIAHFTLYTIGGILIYLYANTFKISIAKRIICAIIFCVIYALSDEIHQGLVPRTRSRNKRCINRYIRSNIAEWEQQY